MVGSQAAVRCVNGVLRVLADGEEVGGGAGDRRVVFHRGQRVEDELSLAGVVQAVLDTGCPAQRALDGQQVPQVKPGVRFSRWRCPPCHGSRPW